MLLYLASNTPLYNIATKFNNSTKHGAERITESNLSKIPPWPGSKLLLSLTPYSRLYADSIKSPNWPITLITKVITIANIKLEKILVVK